METLRRLLISILTAEARIVLAKYRPKIVVVTGSVGKTSTKDAIHTVLASRFKVRKSKKSYNSDIGVPLTILDCENAWSNPWRWFLNLLKGLALIIFPFRYPEWLVLEVGADKPGDLRSLLAWITPDVGVATLFPDVPPHVEFYVSPEQLWIEEMLPILSVKGGGLAVVNADDGCSLSLKDKVANTRVLTYGFFPGSEIRGGGEEIEYEMKNGRKVPSGIRFSVSYKENSVRVVLNDVIGIQHIYPILAGTAVGVSEGIAITDLPQIYAHHKTPPGRMHLIPGIKNTTLIDDTYNSSPVALREALLALGRVETSGRRVAILGDMLELGKYSEEEHHKAGLLAGETVDLLITVGTRAREIADGALDAELSDEAIIQFDDAREAEGPLESLLKDGDIILVKGSQSMRIERLVEDIMAHPEEKEELLVRQEKEWVKKF